MIQHQWKNAIKSTTIINKIQEGVFTSKWTNYENRVYALFQFLVPYQTIVRHWCWLSTLNIHFCRHRSFYFRPGLEPNSLYISCKHLLRETCSRMGCHARFPFSSLSHSPFLHMGNHVIHGLVAYSLMLCLWLLPPCRVYYQLIATIQFLILVFIFCSLLFFIFFCMVVDQNYSGCIPNNWA